jgi:hypothetical protein
VIAIDVDLAGNMANVFEMDFAVFLSLVIIRKYLSARCSGDPASGGLTGNVGVPGSALPRW